MDGSEVTFNESFASSTVELQCSSTIKSSEKDKSINLSGCCSQLDEFCQMVEIRPGRNLRICYIPGSAKLNPPINGCYQETSRKRNKIRTNVDIPIQYSINFAADPSPEMTRKSYLEMTGKDGSLQEDIVKQTAIFFLHGVGGEFKVWSPQIIFFNNLGFTIIAMDFVGHGLSCAPLESSAYHFDEMSSDVLAVFDKYSMSMNVLAGHSYGSSFAAVVTRSRSNLVHSLIMISGGGPFPLGPQEGIFCLPLCILNFLRPCIFRGFLSRSFEKPDKLNACQKAAVGCPMYVLKNTFKGQKWDAGGMDYYSWITCPTLLIHGRRDRLIPSSDALLMENTIHGSELVFVEDSGHMVMLEAPAQTNSIIWKFLSKSLSRFNSAIKINSQLRDKLMTAESTM